MFCYNNRNMKFWKNKFKYDINYYKTLFYLLIINRSKPLFNLFTKVFK